MVSQQTPLTEAPVEYDTREDTYTVRHGFGSRAAASRSVVAAVAAATGRQPTTMRPLYEVVDPDALDRLFAPDASAGALDGSVAFTFEGCSVAVHADGRTVVSPPDRE